MMYWRLFYHIVWTTKHREPLIDAQLASPLHNSLAAKGTSLGALVHAVGGMEDHVHLVASVPPTMALFEFIRNLKGSSSHFANHELSLPGPFRWQAEYGIVSFDGRLLDKVVQYVKNQQQHRADRTTIGILERVSENSKGSDRP